MKRKQERKEALFLIFESDFHKELSPEELLSSAAELRGLVVTEYIRETVTGVLNQMADLDAVITKYLKNWKLSRISSVALAILRMAVYEMKEGVIPENVAVNEAVELAKEFETEDMPAFINGVLGSYSRDKAAETK